MEYALWDALGVSIGDKRQTAPLAIHVMISPMNGRTEFTRAASETRKQPDKTLSRASPHIAVE
jgi:hypothetical protein